jgi:tetratricopeptide (TPR) repeat protein
MIMETLGRRDGRPSASGWDFMYAVVARPRVAALSVLLTLFLGGFFPAGALAQVDEEALRQPLHGPEMGGMAKIWRHSVQFYHAGKYSDLLVELDKLTSAQIDAGVRNVPGLSSALMLMAEHMIESSPGDVDVALRVARKAQALSPGVPDFHFALSSLIWSLDKSMVGEYVGEYFRGVGALVSHGPSLHRLLLGGLGSAWAMGFLVMVFFSLMLLIRHLTLLAHDLGHLLPKGLSKFQLNLAALILLSVPFLMDLGAVPLFALWWVALWMYQSRFERAVTILMVLFVYLWPIFNGLYVNSLAYSDSLADRSSRCMEEACTWDEAAELEAAVEAGVRHQAPLLAAATAHFRATHTKKLTSFEKAFAMYKKGEKDFPRHEGIGFLTGRGNMYFVQGMKRCLQKRSLEAGMDDFAAARKYYDGVLGLEPANWAAMYNKGKLLLVTGNESEARDLVAAASRLAPVRVTELRDRTALGDDTGCSEKFNQNRELAQPILRVPFLWGEAFLREGEEGPSIGKLPVAHELLVGSMECWMLALLSTGVLLAIIAMTVGRRWFKPSVRCIKCGETSCLRCRPELSGTGLCNQCVYYKIRSSYVDPKETWMREKRIENSARLRRKTEAFLTFILPGTGHMLRGRPIRGVLFSWTMGFSLCCIFLFPVLSRMGGASYLQLGEESVVGLAFWCIAAFVTYLLSLIDIYSWR